LSYATPLDARVLEERDGTPFSHTDLPNTTKDSIFALARAFVPPVYPASRRAASLSSRGQARCDIAVLDTNEVLASALRVVYEFLTYANSAITLASTSVSTDVLLTGAPSLWSYCFGAPIHPVDFTCITVNEWVANAYADTFVMATYLEPAEAKAHAIEAEDLSEEDEDDIRLVALRALDRVRSFMGWTDEGMAAAGNFRRSSIYNWERGTRPQVAKVAGLLGLDAFLKSLIRRLGEDGTRTWLDSGDGSRRTRLLQGETASVIADAESIIFPSAALRDDEGYWGEASISPPSLPADLSPCMMMSRWNGRRSAGKHYRDLTKDTLSRAFPLVISGNVTAQRRGHRRTSPTNTVLSGLNSTIATLPALRSSPRKVATSLKKPIRRNDLGF